LDIDLDSNRKRLLPHMRIADNNPSNNRTDADGNHIMRMRIFKNDNHILQLQNLQISASAFSPLMHVLHLFIG
jgi:hypothetical protein